MPPKKPRTPRKPKAPVAKPSALAQATAPTSPAPARKATGLPSPKQSPGFAQASALHQITLGFNPFEDRLLLKISNTDKIEYQLWLTRRFVKVLWGALTRTLERHHPDLQAALAPEIKDAVLAMEHQEAVQASDFSQNHAKGNVNLMSNTGPQLVVGGKVKAGDGELTVIQLQTGGGTDIAFTLNKQILHALCHLIVATVVKTDWDLKFLIGDGNVVVPEKSARLH